MSDFAEKTMNEKTTAHIRLIGNALVDLVMILDRYPREDEELRARGFERRSGGNACNSARWLARQGHAVELVAALAEDVEARWLQDQLRAEGVELSGCQRFPRGSTPISSVWLARRGASRSIVHYRDLPELSLSHLLSLPQAGVGWLHLEGRNCETLGRWLARTETPGSRISLELEKPRPGLEDLLDRVSLGILSRAYLRKTGEDARECLLRLQHRRPWLQLACTMGAEGLWLLDAGAEPQHLPAPRVIENGDSLGAGDVFIAALIAARSRGLGLEQAAQQAQQAVARKMLGAGE